VEVVPSLGEGEVVAVEGVVEVVAVVVVVVEVDPIKVTRVELMDP
jgi:hypothetical protein